MIFNADVLEIIAEYACATVADACALRAANKGYRRAVDTTVRRLVYEDQPELRRTSPDHSSMAPLKLEEEEGEPDSAALDSVRIAFTCDRFSAVARLVVVAFALDGAKDEAHESFECGERPVQSIDSCVFPVAMLVVADPVETIPVSVRNALRRCMVSITVHDPSTTFANIDPVTAFEWPRLSELSWVNLAPRETPPCGSDDADGDGGLGFLVRMLDAVGPQLLKLYVDVGHASAAAVRREVFPAIAASCTNLRQFTAAAVPQLVSESCCDALIASGAPLETVSLSLTTAEGARLIESVPTIHSASIGAVGAPDLSPAALGRLRKLGSAMTAIPNAEIRITKQPPLDLPPPSASLKSLTVAAAAPTGIPTSLRQSFPSLRSFKHHLVDVSAIDRSVRFPPTLENITVQMAPGCPATSFLQVLAASAPLAELSEVIILEDSATTRPVDLTALLPFAATLKTLHVSSRAPLPPGESLDSVVSVLSRLRALEGVEVQGLPTARSFLGGGHARLRELTLSKIGALHDVDADRSVQALVEACPRLCAIEATEDTLDAFVVPTGWQTTFNATGFTAKRISYVSPREE